MEIMLGVVSTLLLVVVVVKMVVVVVKEEPSHFSCGRLSSSLPLKV
jgi:hypothetical protein